MEVKTIDIQHPRFGDEDYMGGFRLTKNRRNVILFIREECPKITWFHETQHLEDFLTLGYKKYTQISKTEPWLHERSVWEKILKNKNKFREIEVLDAYGYVRRYYFDSDLAQIFSETILNPTLESSLEKLLK